MATEESVGLLCFVNNEEPMSGIIKHRYSDFHVHEIDANGNVVYLSSTKQNPTPPYPEGYEEWLSSNEVFFSFKPESDEQIARIYYEQPTFPILKQKNGMVSIERLYKKKTHRLIIHFVLYKENLNQQQAIGKLAKKLDKPKKLFGFAGTKDKRAITTQICSVYDVSPHALIQATSNIGESIQISNIHYAREPISLGDLNGNKFSIVLRDIKLDGFEGQIKNKDMHRKVKEGIRKRIQAVEESGFINYYGMQRFGTSNVPTHHIGILVLKKDWKRIIDILLGPIEGEDPKIQKAKLHFKQTHDAKEASKMIPKSAQTEYSLFKAISSISVDKKGNKIDPLSNPHELFSRIERKQRMLFVHAYQSFLWNHLASLRIKKNGTKIVVGDYVMKSNIKDDVERVTPENINKYTFFDVVLPIPSANNIDDQDELFELMEKDGVTPEMFKKLPSEYGANGGWRLIITKVKDIEWEIITHDDFNAPLIDSDLNLINGISNIDNHVKYGKYTSLSLSFCLGSGQYATMFLRELLKRSTEWFTDSAMSNKNEEESTSSWFSNLFNCSIQ